MENFNCDKWFYLCLSLVGVLVVLFIISHRYNLKWKEKSIQLEINDKQHEQKHHQNVEKIKELEEKNDTLRAKVSTLEGVIETLTKTKSKSNK